MTNIWWTVALLGAVLGTGCVGLDGGDADWEAFRDSAAREVDGKTIYVVEWDRAMTLEELHAYYDAYIAGGTTTQASTVDEALPGADNVWTPYWAMHLSYCITDDFGTDKQRAIDEMRLATRAWEAEAHVHFQYVSGEDSRCDNRNTSIVFSVRPWTSTGACSFFPIPDSTPCVARTLVINFHDLDTNPFYATNAPNVRTVGVFRHELGHILGLRHEQVRVTTTCAAEGGSVRGLTPYDKSSVMHYPWCSGDSTSDLSITDSDADGIRQLYGASLTPSALQFAVADVDGDGRQDIVQYYRGWSTLPTCRYTSAGSFSCSNPGAAIYNWDVQQQLVVGDFNGDRKSDTVQAYRKWSTLPTCLSTGSGWSCSNPGALIWPNAEDTDESRFLVGKFDFDSRSDVLQAYRKWGQLPLCHPTATGGWTCTASPATIYDSGSAEQEFLTGDVDGPLWGGLTDVIQTYRGWGSLPVCRSDGADNWDCSNKPATIYNSGSYEQRFLTGDFNGDGRTDVIQTYRGWGSIPTCLSTADNTGKFTGWSCSNPGAWIINSGSYEQQFLVGDFNGDGKTDVVQAYRGWSSLPLCLSTGSGFSCSNPPATIYNSGSRQQRFIAADVDHDGKTDIIQVYRGWSSYPVCFSTGTGWNCQNLPATLFDVPER